MPEIEARRIPGVEELRDLVERREREELRDDLARTLQEGIGTDKLGEALRRLIRQSLEEVVQQALEGERAYKVIERHVTDRILTSIAGELRDAQRELLAEARDHLAKAWRREASEMLHGSLRREVAESVRRGIREGILDVDFRRELLRALGETRIEDERPSGLPPSTSLKKPAPDTIPPVIRSRRWSLSFFSSVLSALRKQPRVWIGGGAALILIGLSVPVWILASSPKSGSPVRLERPLPELAVATPLPVDSLQEIWMERMGKLEAAPYPSVTKGALARYSFEEQFDCWFNPGSRSRLDDLLRSTYSGDLRSDLQRDIFDFCMINEYSLGQGSMLPVLGAQVIVLDLLRRHASDDWRGCRGRSGFRDSGNLDNFPIDGEPGPRTAEILNFYLENCTDISSLRISPASSTPEYLFVLYAALKDLQERPAHERAQSQGR